MENRPRQPASCFQAAISFFAACGSVEICQGPAQDLESFCGFYHFVVVGQRTLVFPFWLHLHTFLPLHLGVGIEPLEEIDFKLAGLDGFLLISGCACYVIDEL